MDAVSAEGRQSGAFLTDVSPAEDRQKDGAAPEGILIKNSKGRNPHRL